LTAVTFSEGALSAFAGLVAFAAFVGTLLAVALALVAGAFVALVAFVAVEPAAFAPAFALFFVAAFANALLRILRSNRKL